MDVVVVNDVARDEVGFTDTDEFFIFKMQGEVLHVPVSDRTEVVEKLLTLGKRKGDIFYLFIFSAISCALIASSIVTSGASFPSRQFMKWVFN